MVRSHQSLRHKSSQGVRQDAPIRAYFPLRLTLALFLLRSGLWAGFQARCGSVQEPVLLL